MRLDKWLWAARFYKTRSMAADAVDGGKVKLNGSNVKPAKDVKPGDRLHIRAGEQDYEVLVVALNEQRRPAAEARLLYEETPESQERRTREAELRKLAPVPGADIRGRPTKRDRRQLGRFRGE
ncbi:MAG: RNA-binding S4 domain-containing protein [Rhodocyclaceae bacterium]|nr:MAG: RNA-binding S4 domain-containing protein [Rhodocyclaceae bacterium]